MNELQEKLADGAGKPHAPAEPCPYAGCTKNAMSTPYPAGQKIFCREHEAELAKLKTQDNPRQILLFWLIANGQSPLKEDRNGTRQGED